MKHAVAIRHVHFEDLGTLGPVLKQRGYAIRYHDVGLDDFAALDPLAPDLLVVLGGPIGVYETEAYPFLVDETALIARRLASGRPILGICLGAQLVAAALGAKVAPTGVKEIGFSPLTLTDAGRAGPLRHLEGVAVLHWHGDAFAIPDGADHLAATPVCAAQAFALGRKVLCLQFHPEVDTRHGFERWLVGHAAEAAGAGLDARALRADAFHLGPPLRGAAAAMFGEWLDGVEAAGRF